ncbi:hypothetical protein TWF102_009607 [Orbilia oligospora]|uniref:Uncharacterized protein n=1 Tax=Orbilia oligospora TaxID=2813651 RepID=A0A7C8JQQ1_ORBOL|nr:hypothetical protein TWF102_009607 [Orbilia oligospora]KAF3118067.1 hypothetical protein TWF103_000102 [Orbilia oligospora]KAF3134686.1 hypothetical protein TWF703_006344 [Orbilia oligospora]KAF3141519.1 hypothetical protein TWF594_006072 [Orbilia oligospora]
MTETSLEAQSCPIDSPKTKQDIKYPHPLDTCPRPSTIPPLSFHDYILRKFSCSIRNQPNWTTLVTNRKLMSQWIQRSAYQDGDKFSEKTEGFCLVWDSEDIKFAHEELVERYKPYVEELREKGCFIEPDVDCVWRADGVILEELREKLINAASTLEKLPEDKKTWAPAREGIVQDLIHPSWWPIVYGRTLLPNGETITCPFESESKSESKSQCSKGWSTGFCWLPSEFKISPDGKSTSIESYINNLTDPEQQKLFHPILEEVFTQFIPLFNHVLADLNEKRDLSHRTTGGIPGPNSFGASEYASDLSVEEFKGFWEKTIKEYENGEELSLGFRNDNKSRREDFDYYDSGTDGEFGSIRDDDEYEYGEGDAVEDDTSDYNENEILNPESEYHTWVPPTSLTKLEPNDEEIQGSENENSEEGEEGAEGEAKEEKLEEKEVKREEVKREEVKEEEEEENDFDSIFAWKPTDIFDCRFYEIWDIGSTRPDKMWYPPKITDEINLKGKTVKIVVQMTNIMITPENPVQHVGPRNVADYWAYHGLRNERIIATGIYYYAQENIAETTLAFARKTNEKDPLHPCNYHYCSYGFRDRPFQKVGKTSIKQNRLIVFPNIYAHATTLRLEDIKKPGYQKTLTFFLCDPNYNELLTTKTVAPQQPQHRVEVEEAIREGIWGNLPSELFEFVLKSLPPSISVEEAYGYREAMIMTPY